MLTDDLEPCSPTHNILQLLIRAIEAEAEGLGAAEIYLNEAQRKRRCVMATKKPTTARERTVYEGDFTDPAAPCSGFAWATSPHS